MNKKTIKANLINLAIFVISAANLTSCHEPIPPGAPELISPSDRSGFTESPPVFVWSLVEDADTYLLRIAQDSITSPKIILDIRIEDTTYSLSQSDFNQLPSGEYFWAVASLSANDDTVWSDAWVFEIIKAEPDTTKLLIAPSDADTFDITAPVFFWHRYQTSKGYILRVAKDNFLTGAILIQDSLMDTSFTTPDSVFEKALNGNYIWSVAPIPDTGKLYWWEFRTLTIEKPLPNPPTLLFPQKDENISTAPTFVWQKEPLAEYYRIKVYGQDLPMPDTIISDKTSDTAYSLSEEKFRICYNGKYLWQVAAVAPGGEIFWSEPQEFYFNKTIPEVDLDTTYFPLGLNYKWIYEVYGGEPGSSYPYDTITVQVTDSSAVFNGWNFVFDGAFLDVGNTAKIVDNIVPVFSHHKSYLEPDQIKKGDFTIGFRADTAVLSTFSNHSDYPYGGWESSTSVTRLKDLGAIYQEYLYYTYDEHHNPIYMEYEYDRLLYFIKGQDTVWKSTP